MPRWGKPVAQRKLTSCSPRSLCGVKSQQPTAATFPAACCFARMFKLESSVQAAADAGNRNLNSCPSCPEGARRATVGEGGNLRSGPQHPISPDSSLIGLNASRCDSIRVAIELPSSLLDGSAAPKRIVAGFALQGIFSISYLAS